MGSYKVRGIMTTKVVSANSYIMEPSGLWPERLDQSFRDHTPRVVHDLCANASKLYGVALE